MQVGAYVFSRNCIVVEESETCPGRVDPKSGSVFTYAVEGARKQSADLQELVGEDQATNILGVEPVTFVCCSVKS